MEICFAGTGAADWNWSEPLSAGCRGSTCTLLNSSILIDAGPTALESLKRAGKNPAEVTELLITHTHSDHFNPAQIEGIANAPGRVAPLRIYLSQQGAERLKSPGFPCQVLSFGQELLLAGGVKALVLPANHLLTDPAEAACHFLFTAPEGIRLLYALDGAWMVSYARALIGSKPLDMIVWDATSGTSDYDWRFAEHNDLLMIRHQMKAMEKVALTGCGTKHYFDHIARTLWPETPEERTLAAEKAGGILAEDGMTVRIG